METPLDDAEETHTPETQPAIPRRELLGAAASGLFGLVAACGSAEIPTEVIRTAEGRVLQWQGNDLLVLVSGLQDTYGRGQEVRLKIILNNQTPKLGVYRLRTKLVARANQAVAEAPVASMQVSSYDAAETERIIDLKAIEPGNYTLVVELPPWSLDGRAVGPGGALTAPVRLEP